MKCNSWKFQDLYIITTKSMGGIISEVQSRETNLESTYHFSDLRRDSLSPTPLPPPLFFSLPYLMFHLSHLCGVNCSVELQRSQDSGGSIRRWWWPWSDPSLLHVLFKRDVAMRLIRNEVWVIRGFFFSYFFYLSPGCFPCLVFVLVWFS